jgi:hypothetical protein
MSELERLRLELQIAREECWLSEVRFLVFRAGAWSSAARSAHDSGKLVTREDLEEVSLMSFLAYFMWAACWHEEKRVEQRILALKELRRPQPKDAA